MKPQRKRVPRELGMLAGGSDGDIEIAQMNAEKCERSIVKR